MITKVTYEDYRLIKNSFTEEEIKSKYGYLKIMSQEEYKEELKRKKYK